MSETNPPEPTGDPQPPGSGAINEQIQHAPLSARIPTHVGRGVFSTGAIVFEGPSEFVLDFVLRTGSPHCVAARVAMPHGVFAQFINALKANLKGYEDKFGAPRGMPAPPPGATRTTIAELYEQLKLPDEMLSGVYANGVMIGHTPAEFWFDFITNFYPRSAVSARVFLSAQQAPGLLQTMIGSYQAFQKKQAGNRPQQPPPPPAPPSNDGQPGP